ELVEKINKRKQVFYGCSNFPQCKFATNYKPIPQPCPECGKLLVLARDGRAKCTACQYKVKLAELESEKQCTEEMSLRGTACRSNLKSERG
ncbi:MAG: hypothetical protein COX14_05665, partial [Chloroflexi bacterium CG23_combo_of_CG06-09_8_20_14_all_45_10]